MPIYEYQCPQGHRLHRFFTVQNHQPQSVCDCGLIGQQVITAPLMVKCAQDVCYDSPIDGAPITSWHAREEDLKRNNCQPYDPEMKTDYRRRIEEGEAQLDKLVDTHVDAAWEKMPTAKRAKLASEIVEQGYDAEYARGSKTA